MDMPRILRLFSVCTAKSGYHGYPGRDPGTHSLKNVSVLIVSDADMILP